MGDSNKKQLTVDDVPDVFETFRGETGSKIAQKIHSPTGQAFSKSILPNQLRDKSHDLWLHPSVKFLSDSVGDASVLLTSQNSGSNDGHVEGYSIDTTESSDVIQEIRFQTEKLRDSTDHANLLRVVDTRDIEAGATCGTMQAAFGNSTLPNAPPKWFLEYMEAFKRDLFESSVSRLDKIEEKLEKIIAILAANPVLAANTEENTIKTTNVSTENQNVVVCGSYLNTDGLIELQKPPTQLNMSSCSSPKIPGDTVDFAATASPREHLDEPVVNPEIIQDTLAPEIPHVEHQGTVESPISMDAFQDRTDNILLLAAPECLNKAIVVTDDPLGGSKEIRDNGKHSLTFIACPHGCETAGLTQEGIETHIKESCSALTVNCSFEKVECGFKGTQYTVEKHEEESTRHHLGLMCAHLQKGNSWNLQSYNLKSRCKRKKRRIQGTQYTVEKHEEESTRHHLGLMCSFAERQQLELAKLQSQIEVQTKEKKNSGIFLHVAESESNFYSYEQMEYCGRCPVLEGIDIRQNDCFKEKLLLSNTPNTPILQHLTGVKYSSAHEDLQVDQYGRIIVHWMQAVELLSYLKKEYGAKIVAHSFDSNTKFRNWTLEVDEL